jgi:hypothetical protein
MADRAWRNDHADRKHLPSQCWPMRGTICANSWDSWGRTVWPNDPLTSSTLGGIIRFACATDTAVGRNPERCCRFWTHCKTDELCSGNWKKGEAILQLPKQFAEAVRGRPCLPLQEA